MDPFWTFMAIVSMLVSFFAPWWCAMLLTWCAWQYLKWAGEFLH